MVPISGFTLVRNAVHLDFPLVESIRSVLPVVDEFVVNVGKSDDETMDLVRSLDDPRIRVVESTWDWSDKMNTLGRETRRAMEACRHGWGIYIQADEVLSDGGAELLRQAVQEYDADRGIEGMRVNYLHFYGDFSTLATNRKWYQHEVRCVRLGEASGVHPFRDAQGFRVGSQDRKIRVKATDSTVFHYGWARPPASIQRKRDFNREILDPQGAREVRETLPWIPLLRPFTGAHPAVVRRWIEERTPAPGERRIDDPAFDWQWPRMYLSHAWERMTGQRPLTFRNYELV